MRKTLLSLLMLFLCIQINAQEENEESNDIKIERMCRFELVQQLDEQMQVTSEESAKGVVVIGTQNGVQQIAFGEGDKAFYDLTVIKMTSEQLSETRLTNTFVCKSNVEGDTLLYNVLEFFDVKDPENPIAYIVSGVNPETMTVESMEQFNMVVRVQ